MEKVEVVIKIPKYYLTHPQDYSCLAECVRRGTPLPKGHGWIPVSERLPEVDGEYLATIYDMDEGYKYTDIAELENGIWNYKNYIKVLAWMPLPEPYEPQESENKEVDNG